MHKNAHTLDNKCASRAFWVLSSVHNSMCFGLNLLIRRVIISLYCMNNRTKLMRVKPEYGFYWLLPAYAGIPMNIYCVHCDDATHIDSINCRWCDFILIHTQYVDPIQCEWFSYLANQFGKLKNFTYSNDYFHKHHFRWSHVDFIYFAGTLFACEWKKMNIK